MQIKTITKSVTVRYPDSVSECTFTFASGGSVWTCAVTGDQGTKTYAVAGNVTGAEAASLASVAGKFLALYQADVNAGAV